MDIYQPLEYGHAEPFPGDPVDEVRTPGALVERFLRKHTQPGTASSTRSRATARR